MHQDRDVSYWHANSYRAAANLDDSDDQGSAASGASEPGLHTPSRTPQRGTQGTPPTLHREAPRMTMRGHILAPPCLTSILTLSLPLTLTLTLPPALLVMFILTVTLTH